MADKSNMYDQWEKTSVKAVSKYPDGVKPKESHVKWEDLTENDRLYLSGKMSDEEHKKKVQESVDKYFTDED